MDHSRLRLSCWQRRQRTTEPRSCSATRASYLAVRCTVCFTSQNTCSPTAATPLCCLCTEGRKYSTSPTSARAWGTSPTSAKSWGTSPTSTKSWGMQRPQCQWGDEVVLEWGTEVLCCLSIDDLGEVLKSCEVCVWLLCWQRRQRLLLIREWGSEVCVRQAAMSVLQYLRNAVDSECWCCCRFLRLHTLAFLDYVVVVLDSRGSSHRGVQFEAHIKGRLVR